MNDTLSFWLSWLFKNEKNIIVHSKHFCFPTNNQTTIVNSYTNSEFFVFYTVNAQYFSILLKYLSMSELMIIGSTTYNILSSSQLCK